MKPIDRIIAYFREEMMTANPPGGQGGYTSNPPKPGVAGYDKVMKGPIRRRSALGLWASSLKKKKKKKGES